MRFRTDFAATRWIIGGVATAAIAIMAAVAPSPVLAQDKEQSAWVKLCETAKMPKAGKDGKVEADERDICLTHHERLDGNTGMVIVSAAIRVMEGEKEPSLMIMVPLGMAIPPGVRAAVYSEDQWQKWRNKEKIDEAALKPINLKYSLCHPAGCTAEIKATAEMMEQMKTGGALMVLAINAAGQPIGFPVPLTGFTQAHAGKPVDNKLYAQERGKLMAQIRERQRTLVEQARAKREGGEKKN